MNVKTIDLQADLDAVCQSIAHNTSVDAETAARVRERAAEVRAELAARGTLNVAVDLLREIRDE